MSNDRRKSLSEQMDEPVIEATDRAQWAANEERDAALDAERTPAAVDREALGREARRVWIAWAREQPTPKPSWLVPWEDLSEPDREVDRRIGEALHFAGFVEGRADYAAAVRTIEDLRRRIVELTGPPRDREAPGVTLWLKLARFFPPGTGSPALRMAIDDAATALHTLGTASRDTEVSNLIESINAAHSSIAGKETEVKGLRVQFLDAIQDRDEAQREAEEAEQEKRVMAAHLTAARAEVERLTRELAAARDCGQAEVCASAPGCQRHWEERNRELAAKLAAARAEGACEEREAHRAAIDSLRELVETYEEDNPGRPCVVVARRELDAIRARGPVR